MHEKVTSSKTDEHYTPEKITQYLYQFGEIDLDPCSNAGRNIRAKEYYTIETNGLTKPWHGYVFVNPPFSDAKLWVPKAIQECKGGAVTDLIFLTKTDCRTAWFADVINTFPLHCLVQGYLSYLGNKGNKAAFGTALWYWGNQPNRFKQIFSQLGWVCTVTT